MAAGSKITATVSVRYQSEFGPRMDKILARAKPAGIETRLDDVVRILLERRAIADRRRDPVKVLVLIKSAPMVVRDKPALRIAQHRHVADVATLNDEMERQRAVRIDEVRRPRARHHP